MFINRPVDSWTGMGGGGMDSQYIVLSELLSDQAAFITSPKTSLANYWGGIAPLPPSVYGPVYKAINKLSPVYFHNYFTLDSSVHRFETRQATRGDLYISLKRTTLDGLKTVQYFGSKLWNTLPLFIRVAASITDFRSKLKAYIIDSYA